jgi:hypothetical protein
VTDGETPRSPESLARLILGEKLDLLTAPLRDDFLDLAERALSAEHIINVAARDERMRRAHDDVKTDRLDREMPKRVRAAFAGGFVGTVADVAFLLGRHATERDHECVRYAVGRLSKSGLIVKVRQHRGASGAKVYAATAKLRREMEKATR